MGLMERQEQVWWALTDSEAWPGAPAGMAANALLQRELEYSDHICSNLFLLCHLCAFVSHLLSVKNKHGSE